MEIDVKIMRVRDDAQIPRRSTPESAGYDLCACFENPDQNDITVTQSPVLFGSGIALELPPGFQAEVRPRSSLSKLGCILPTGTIDSDYRGEIMLVLYMCFPGGKYLVLRGDRVAQLVINRVPKVFFIEVPNLSQTMRGAGGFGSTGRR